MTSMIDVVFLLISFFTLVINFTQTEQREEIVLPKSELAQPPDSAPPEQIVVQALDDQSVFLGTLKCSIEENFDLNASSFASALRDELHILNVVRKVEPKDVTIILRGDRDVDVGFVQKLILACQNQGIDAFVLRARQARDE